MIIICQSEDRIKKNPELVILEKYIHIRFLDTELKLDIEKILTVDYFYELIVQPKCDQTPLITHEDATEQLGNGEFDSNLEKITDEMAQIKKAGLPDIVPLPPVSPVNKDVKD